MEGSINTHHMSANVGACLSHITSGLCECYLTILWVNPLFISMGTSAEKLIIWNKLCSLVVVNMYTQTLLSTCFAALREKPLKKIRQQFWKIDLIILKFRPAS